MEQWKKAETFVKFKENLRFHQATETLKKMWTPSLISGIVCGLVQPKEQWKKRENLSLTSGKIHSFVKLKEQGKDREKLS